MKQQKILDTILKTYYTLTANKFYSREQLERIMELLAWTSDSIQEKNELVKIVDKINENNFPSSAFCRNTLMLSALTMELSELETVALRALCSVLEKTKGEEYLTMHAWLKDLAKPDNLVEKAIFYYAQEQYEGAIELLKKAKSDNSIIPIEESIAFIGLKGGLYEVALESAAHVIYFDEGIMIKHSAMQRVMEIAKEKLNKAEADRIVESARTSKKVRIGF